MLHCGVVLLMLLSLVLTEHIVSENEKDDILNTDDSAEAFNKYMAMFGENKLKASPELIKHQKQVFFKNLNEIKSHNKDFEEGKSEFAMTVNIFTDKDHLERQKFLGLSNFSDTSLGSYFVEENPTFLSSGMSAASSLDWKSKMVPVKQQGSCGSCWAYPTNAVIEFAYQKLTGSKKSFSEQEVLDCTYEGQRDGCQGGLYEHAWSSIIRNNHLASEKDYPYNGKDGRCKYTSYTDGMKGVMKLTGYIKVTKKSESEFIKAANIMPLAVAFHVEDAFFSLGNGVYDGCKTFKSSNHAVTLTGYTPTSYEIKNSWGKNWGNSGYGRFKRSGDICNLLSDAMYIKYQDLGGDGDGGDKDGDNNNDGDDSKCTDTDNRCPGWKSYCSKAQYMDYMERTCPKTCQKCGKDDNSDGKCANKLNFCVELPDFCNHATDGKWVQDNCPKTCGKCKEDEDTDDNCVDGKSFCRDISKYCDHTTDGKWVQDNCPKTCAKC